MRRDLCYFYPVPVQPTFDAFVQAANQQFGKGCKIDAYKTISFGLNYSFKYNMNGRPALYGRTAGGRAIQKARAGSDDVRRYRSACAGAADTAGYQ